MGLRLGDLAPNFKAKTSQGEIDFYEFLGDSWGVLFSHPADYTPVCTTELGKTASLKSEFDKRNVKVAALSVDSVESHKGWINDINETQNVEVNFPIIGDENREIALAYDMIHPNASLTATVRSLFIIAPDKTINEITTWYTDSATPYQWHSFGFKALDFNFLLHYTAGSPQGKEFVKHYSTNRPMPSITWDATFCDESIIKTN